MSNPRTPNLNPNPSGPRARPRDERAALAASGRTNRWIALAALAIAGLALGLVAWRSLIPAPPGCQTTAWDATPAADQLPSGWTTKATSFESNRKTISYAGPAPADTSSPQAILYATVTCFPAGAADAVTRAAAAAGAAGQTVTDRTDLGEQAYSAVDASGAIFLQLRRADVVVDLAASGGVTPTEVDQVASAFDVALGGAGGTVATRNPAAASASDAGLSDGSSPGATDNGGASASPAAPALEKALPTAVGTVQLTVESTTGASILSGDQNSRAIVAALKADGKTADSLKVAQAYDAAGNSDLAMMAIAVDGLPIAKVKDLVLGAWLAATGPGVTRSEVTLAGRAFTKIDYGDAGTIDYVAVAPDKVIVITTSDATLATQAAAALP